MAQDNRATLLEKLKSITQENGDLEAVIKELARREIGERRAQELEKLTSEEAFEFLKSVDNSELSGASVLVWERLDRDAEAEICIAYMRRSGGDARRTGATRIGWCLRGTRNREASRALAQLICATEEENDIKWKGYVSLELIQWDKNQQLEVPESVVKDISNGNDVLREIDWNFVKTFL